MKMTITRMRRIRMKLELVQLELPEDSNIIIGHAHFIKTVDDIFEALAGSVPNIKFGIAFNEASQERLIRHDGNDPSLEETAIRNAMAIGSGHTFVILIKEAFPINIMVSLKNVHEICCIYCATANPVQVITTSTEQGKAVLGVVDGMSPLGVEEPKHRDIRHKFLKDIGYKP